MITNWYNFIRVMQKLNDLGNYFDEVCFMWPCVIAKEDGLITPIGLVHLFRIINSVQLSWIEFHIGDFSVHIVVKFEA